MFLPLATYSLFIFHSITLNIHFLHYWLSSFVVIVYPLRHLIYHSCRHLHWLYVVNPNPCVTFSLCTCLYNYYWKVLIIICFTKWYVFCVAMHFNIVGNVKYMSVPSLLLCLYWATCGFTILPLTLGSLTLNRIDIGTLALKNAPK